MLSFGLIDDVVKEPLGGAHMDPEKMVKSLRTHIKKEITSLMELSADQLIEGRLEKYSKMGKFTTVAAVEDKAKRKK